MPDQHPGQHARTPEAGGKRQQQRLRDPAAVTAGSGISLRLYVPAKAVQAAMQKLMDDGTYMKILKHWGVESGAVDKAEINPTDLG